MVNLILCGGVGSRLWPISRKLMPKQFYPLLGNTSLFESTVKRNLSLCEKILIAANEDQAFLAFDQLKNCNYLIEEGLIETVGRNTAPAIALSIFALDPETLVLVTPSDHLITKELAYKKAIEKAQVLAMSGNLVTFGIKPSYAETGFGYIKANGNIVEQFCEKPDIKTAESYLADGSYLWNSGMFLFKAGVFLEELQHHNPQVYEACLTAYNNCTERKLLKPQHSDMVNIPSISIDYGVMEPSQKVAVVPCDIGWSDLGSFDSLYDECFNPNIENSLIGIEDPILINSRGNLLVGQEKKLALIDVEDLMIIDSPDALLIAKRGSGQDVKKVVDKLKEENSSLLDAPVKVKRPWGEYRTLTKTSNYIVRHISINPGANLSIHKHFNRQEHWQVVKGLAKVKLDEIESTLVVDQKITIPAGLLHSVRNIGDVQLVIIEIQSGEVVDPEDILRIGYDW